MSAILRRCRILICVLSALLLFPVGAMGALAATATPTASAPTDPNTTVAYSRNGKVSYETHTATAASSKSGGHSGHDPRGHAGASGPSPFDVIGNSWVQVTDTSYPPDPATVYLNFGPNSNPVQCTGWMIRANFVVTAGHCVYDVANRRWNAPVTIAPGKNGSSNPFGTCGWTVMYTVTEFTNNGDRNYDYGGIKLDCNVGSSTGTFGLYWDTNDGDYNNKGTWMLSYPGDVKPDGQMWQSYGQISAVQTYRLFYSDDTSNGSSGAPAFDARGPSDPWCRGSCVMAIHTTGNDVFPYNSGTRITQDVFNNLESWGT